MADGSFCSGALGASMRVRTTGSPLRMEKQFCDMIADETPKIRGDGASIPI